MANERITENHVRDQLRDLEYYDDGNTIRVEEQKSEIAEVKKLLLKAGKSGRGGRGAPEFIISNAKHPDFLVIFECKGDIKFHKSKDGSDPVNYAVDGVLHYAKSLSQSFNVIAIAVSGEDRNGLLISTYLHTKGAATSKELNSKTGAVLDSLIPWDDYIEHASFDPAACPAECS